MLRFVRSAASSSAGGCPAALASRLAPPRLAAAAALLSALSRSPTPRSTFTTHPSVCAPPHSAGARRWASVSAAAGKQSKASARTTTTAAAARRHDQLQASESQLQTFVSYTAALKRVPGQPAITPTSAPGDQRAYRVITLDNGMRCALVSDPFSERAAASLDVGVGSWSDPASLSGLAHLCSRVLLSSLHPDGGSFNVSAPSATAEEKTAREEVKAAETEENKIGSKKAEASAMFSWEGSTDTLVEPHHSRLSFNIEHARSTPALSRFAEIIQAPHFAQEEIDRSVDALEADYRQQLKSIGGGLECLKDKGDEWRTFQLLRAMANPHHPFARFAEGNQATLRDEPTAAGVDVRSELIKFHRAHYTADRMSLAVSGRESLDQLEQMVRGAFESIPSATAGNAQVHASVIGSNVFTPAQLGRFVRIVPDDDQDGRERLQFLWQFDADVSQCYPYAKDSLEFLASLLAYTEANTDDFRTGGGRSEESAWIDGQPHADVLFTTHFSLLTFTLALTEKGMDHTQELLEHVMSFIKHELPAVLGKRYWKEIHRSSFDECDLFELEKCKSMGHLDEQQKVAALKQVKEDAKARQFSPRRQEEINKASLPLVQRLSRALHVFPPERVVTESTEGLDCSATAKHFARLLADPSRMRVHLTSTWVKSAEREGLKLNTERWSGVRYLDEPMPSLMIRSIAQPRRVVGLHHSRDSSSSWRELLRESLALHGESWVDVQHCTLDDAGLDKRFSLGCSAWAEPFTLWTATRVYMEREHDGAYSVTSRERQPPASITARGQTQPKRTNTEQGKQGSSDAEPSARHLPPASVR